MTYDIYENSPKLLVKVATNVPKEELEKYGKIIRDYYDNYDNANVCGHVLSKDGKLYSALLMKGKKS